MDELGYRHPRPLVQRHENSRASETGLSAHYHLFLQVDNIAVLLGSHTPYGRPTKQVNQAGVTERRECLSHKHITVESECDIQ